MVRALKIMLFMGLSANAAADSLETNYLAQLAHARTRKQVERLNAAYADLKTARLACRIQLREHMAPVACYRALRLEGDLHLYSAFKRTRLRLELDGLCRSASRELQIPEGDLRGVSPPCMRALTAARRIQEYRRAGGAEFVNDPDHVAPLSSF